MILSEWNESTKDLNWGKYDSPMAKYVHYLTGDGRLHEDEWDSLPDAGEYVGRYGRRIQYVDSRGFVYLFTYADEVEAVAAFAELTSGWHAEDEDEYPTPSERRQAEEERRRNEPGGLLDEVRQAERLLGTE